jgi:polyisoprenoid-binding protein YceI
VLSFSNPTLADTTAVTASYTTTRDTTMHYLGDDKDWDKELSDSEHFLDAARSPTARFVSSTVQRTGHDGADVHGTLTLRGIARPFTFATTYNGFMPDRQTGRPRIGFSARGLLKRSEFGIDFALGPRMPDDVQIIVEAELVQEEGGSAS